MTNSVIVLPDCCAHSNLADSTSMSVGKQIPFMMYTSELLREKFPNIMYQLDSVFASDFNMGELLETMMTMLAVQER